MASKTYAQFCPIAYTLDVIGERWTLLIVRELALYGPRRYTDFLDALPGISTNLLVSRLKELETAGVIYQRKLPRPAASTVYDLTELGQGLREPLVALLQWGFNLLRAPIPEGYAVNPALARFFLRHYFTPQRAEALNVIVEFQLEQDYRCRAAIRSGQLSVDPPLEVPADVIIKTDLNGLALLLQGDVSPKASVKKKMVVLVHGQLETLETIMLAFGPDRTPV